MANPQDVNDFIDLNITGNRMHQNKGEKVNSVLKRMTAYTTEVKDGSLVNLANIDPDVSGDPNLVKNSVFASVSERVGYVKKVVYSILDPYAISSVVIGGKEYLKFTWSPQNSVDFNGQKAVNGAAGTNSTDFIIKSQLDSAIVGLLDDRGGFDASGGGYPTTNGSGSAGAILKGDIYHITVDGAIGVAGEWVRALTDTPGQTAGNWSKTYKAGLSGGTDTYIPLWTGTNSLTSSVLLQDGSSNIGINKTTSITAKVHIKGATTDNTAYGVKIDSSSDVNNFAVRNDGYVFFKGGSYAVTEVTAGFTNLYKSDTSAQGLKVGALLVGSSYAPTVPTNGAYIAGSVNIGDSNKNARLAVKGSTADSSAYGLQIDDISNGALAGVRNDGYIFLNRLEVVGTDPLQFRHRDVGSGYFFQIGADHIQMGINAGERMFFQVAGDTKAFVRSTHSSFLQSVSINDDGTAPVASAKLELTSTTKGLLPPRMTTTQRDAISSPAEGLVIYNTTTHKLNVYTTVWEAVTSI